MKLGLRGAVGALAVVAVAGCGGGGSLVLVEVTAASPLGAVSRLHVTATVDAQANGTSQFDVPLKGAPVTIPPQRSFAIDVPSKYSGTITVQVDAYDAQSVLLASADSNGPLSPGHQTTLSLVFGGTLADGGLDGATDIGSQHDLAPPPDLATSYTLTMAPPTQNFVSVAEGTDGATASFMVSSNGTTGALPAAHLTGAGAASFVITNDGCVNQILTSSGSPCTVTIRFHPVAAGQITAALAVGNASSMLTASATGTWSVATPSGAGASELFTGVWATPGSTSVWLTSNPGISTGSVWHRDSSGTWTEPKNADSATQYNAVWGLSDTDLWVGGTSTVSQGAPLMYHRGVSGTFALSGTGINVSDTGAVTSLTGFATNDVWATLSSGGTDACIHWAGSTWATDSTPSTTMTALWLDPATKAGFAVGVRDVVPDTYYEIYRRSAQGAWTTPKSVANGSAFYYGVWGAGPTAGVVVGAAGLIYATDGTTFSAASPAPTASTLNGVWGSSANDIYAVGGSGVILHSTGNNAWTSQTSPTSANLAAIYGTSSGDIWAVGTGVVLHYK